MDPITKMAQDFMNNWQRFRQSREARFFRIDTDPSMHRDLWRLFRAIEMAPDNRSPYLIFRTPFVDRTAFYFAAIQKLSEDYALLREGLGKDGVTIDEWHPAETQGEPEDQFVAALHAMWERVSFQFEYLMIIFLPDRLEAKNDWENTVERLARLLSSSKVRLAVADTPENKLAGLSKTLDKQALSARFFIASSAVQEYLMKVAAGGFAAISGRSQSITKPGVKTAQAGTRAAARGNEKQEPIRSSSETLPADEAALLRTYMAKAAVASAERMTDDALTALQKARAICNRNSLLSHEAILLIATANTYLADNQNDSALAHYRDAIATATQAQALVVVMQARIGLASTLFRGQLYDNAAETYELAARDAAIAETQVMAIEALRMAGTCHNLQGRPGEAARCWDCALTFAKDMPPAEVNASTIHQVGEEIIRLCNSRGLPDQAASVARQIEEIMGRSSHEQHSAFVG
jgi:tetratricopeptide (TPR) repeat protein